MRSLQVLSPAASSPRFSAFLTVNRTLGLEFFFSQQRFTHDLGALVCPSVLVPKTRMTTNNGVGLENSMYPSRTRGIRHGVCTWLLLET